MGLAHNMRAVALAADTEVRSSGRKATMLENCGGSLQRVFASAIGGSEFMSIAIAALLAVLSDLPADEAFAPFLTAIRSLL